MDNDRLDGAYIAGAGKDEEEWKFGGIERELQLIGGFWNITSMRGGRKWKQMKGIDRLQRRT